MSWAHRQAAAARKAGVPSVTERAHGLRTNHLPTSGGLLTARARAPSRCIFIPGMAPNASKAAVGHGERAGLGDFSWRSIGRSPGTCSRMPDGRRTFRCGRVRDPGRPQPDPRSTPNRFRIDRKAAQDRLGALCWSTSVPERAPCNLHKPCAPWTGSMVLTPAAVGTARRNTRLFCF